MSTKQPNTILRGDGTWPWHAEVDGEDIVLHNVRATCFGGSNDPQDSGKTASGINTKGHPNLLGCSLPLSRNMAALRGSPLPSGIPFKKTAVDVEFIASGKKITVPLIDLGPGKRTGNAIDLTIAAARVHNPKASATNFEARVNVRIRGAAKYV